MLSKKNIATVEISISIFLTIFLLSLMYYFGGTQTALSKYALLDETRFLFKFWVFTLALGAARNSQFRYTAFPLLGLGMFDTVTTDLMTQIVHNISAYLFFGLTTYYMFQKKRSQIFGVLVILGSPVAVYSLFWAEMLFVGIIISYLIFILYRKHKLGYEKINKRYRT